MRMGENFWGMYLWADDVSKFFSKVEMKEGEVHIYNEVLTKKEKMIIGGVYAVSMEGRDVVNEYRGIPKPDSILKTEINKISPFKKETFKPNDT
jgi:hypothetical protein